MSMKSNIDALLGDAIAGGAAAGVVAGATNADGDIYLGGFGERVAGGGVEMTPDTVGWIASMTKAITGAAAMQLVEQGRLDLDAPASEVIPQLGDVPVLEGFDDDGSPGPARPAARSPSATSSPTPPASPTTSGTSRWSGTRKRPARPASSSAATRASPPPSPSTRASAGTTASASTGRGRWSRR